MGEPVTSVTLLMARASGARGTVVARAAMGVAATGLHGRCTLPAGMVREGVVCGRPLPGPTAGSALERRNNDAVNRSVGRLDAAFRIGVAGVRKAAEHNCKSRDNAEPGCDGGYPAHGGGLLSGDRQGEYGGPTIRSNRINLARR
jgi:hypothetical protein